MISNLPPRPAVPVLALRPKDAAKALGIGERKLWEMTKLNQIPHVKHGACVMYPVAMLEKWLAAEAAKAVNS
jgi:hypothetical protein